MAKKSFFITGTDTEVGKSLITAALLEAANKLELRTLGLKPLAAGAQSTAEGLRNEDALLLQEYSSIKLSYEQVNPVVFEPAIAPHIAAQQEDKMLSAERLAAFCRGALLQPADLVLVEGAGGWRIPLNNRETLAQLPKILGLPVIMVVSMKLGCINQALLTAEAISRDGLQLVGWIANQVESDMAYYQENKESIVAMLRAPLLAEIPHLSAPSPSKVAAHIDIQKLLA